MLTTERDSAVGAALRGVRGLIAEVESAATKHREATEPTRRVTEVAVILVTVAVSLTAINFLRDGSTPVAVSGALGAPNAAFDGLARWALVSIVGYVVPALVASRLLGIRWRDLGLVSRRAGVGPYVALFVASVPFIAVAASNPEFLARYPFYRLAEGESWVPYLAAWWVLYAVQFVALEFFFRGFMVHALKDHLGVAAVFVMVVPYAMIHFNKPMVEALAAIVGGTVLGFFSLQGRSIWPAAALHIAIAASMDLFALFRLGA